MAGNFDEIEEGLSKGQILTLVKTKDGGIEVGSLYEDETDLAVCCAPDCPEDLAVLPRSISVKMSDGLVHFPL